ncbi:hypothetical protein [Sphingomonas sp.]|uniref:hypothetical protein n=1 Tax=Sphingomonas sp. TaxID=28214 RepID=UPI003B006A15
MAALIAEPSSYDPRGRPRDRMAALLAAILLPLLLLWMLLRLGVLPSLAPAGAPALVTLSFKGQDAERARVVREPKHAAGRRAASTTKPAPSRVQANPSPVPSLNILHVGHDELAALDLAMATHRDRGEGQTAGAGSGADDGDAGSAGGGGAGGDRLYDPDWYRRPSDVEMSTYLQQVNARSGWGEIACRTAPRFRVEDCREIGESPGSGIARALREAAWQFQVLPPRVNSRPMIGAWVRIHFDVIQGFRRG